jgi:hypothetical protein
MAEYDSLRQLVLADEDYDPTSMPVMLLERGLHVDDPLDLLDAVDQMSWIWQLCPRLHFVQARIYEQMDADAPMQASVARMQTCLRMLLKTGDGSEKQPYRLIFRSDARDVLWTRRAEVHRQQLVQQDDRWLDVMTDKSGGDHYFDVTELLMHSHLAQPTSPGAVSL